MQAVSWFVAHSDLHPYRLYTSQSWLSLADAFWQRASRKPTKAPSRLAVMHAAALRLRDQVSMCRSQSVAPVMHETTSAGSRNKGHTSSGGDGIVIFSLSMIIVES